MSQLKRIIKISIHGTDKKYTQNEPIQWKDDRQTQITIFNYTKVMIVNISTIFLHKISTIVGFVTVKLPTKYLKGTNLYGISRILPIYGFYKRIYISIDR